MNKPYILYTDASDFSIGACLVQKQLDNTGVEIEVPIYLLSHKLSDTQTRWATIEKEVYAIHYALQKLDLYLHDAQFVIRTDHKPLQYLLGAPMQNRKIQMWALSIAGYNCSIEYLPGKDNLIADLLSRMSTAEYTQSVSVPTPDIGYNALEIKTINSNLLNVKDHASTIATPGETHELS